MNCQKTLINACLFLLLFYTNTIFATEFWTFVYIEDNNECECFDTCAFKEIEFDSSLSLEPKLLDLDEISSTLLSCIRYELSSWEDLKKRLYFYEVTHLAELIKLYEVHNNRLNFIYKILKKEQQNDWQKFLDWQDKNVDLTLGGRISTSQYNKKFDEVMSIAKQKWYEQEKYLKLFISQIPSNIKTSQVFQFWNKERLKNIDKTKKKMTSQLDLVDLLEKRLHEVEAIMSRLVSK